MMRKPVEDGAAPLDVFGAADSFDALPTDISFGAGVGRSRRPPKPGKDRKRPANAWFIGVGVAALVVAAFVFGDRSATRSSPAPSTRQRSVQPTTSSAAATSSPVSRSVPLTTSAATLAETTTLPTVGPLYANSEHLGLYLITQDSTGSAELRRVDLETGSMSRVTSRPVSNSSQIIGIAPVDGGAVPVTASEYIGQPSVSRGPGGTVWVLGGDEDTLRQLQYKPDGSFDVLLTVPGIRATDEVRLVGSTADLRPVVELADARAYDVAVTTGGLHRLTDGAPTAFELGFFAETICTDAGTCGLRLHGSGSPRDITRPHGYVQTSFSPDGRTVLVSGQATQGLGGAIATLIDLGTGDSEPVTLLTQNYFGGTNIAWTPDSSSFFWVEQGTSSLSRLDVASRVIVRYDISSQLGEQSLQGLAGIA